MMMLKNGLILIYALIHCFGLRNLREFDLRKSAFLVFCESFSVIQSAAKNLPKWLALIIELSSIRFHNVRSAI